MNKSASEVAADWLTGFAAAGEIAAPLLPGVGPSIARGAAAGLGLIADLFRAGSDPIAEITRIRDAHPLLQGMKDRWQARIRAKFGT